MRTIVMPLVAALSLFHRSPYHQITRRSKRATVYMPVDCHFMTHAPKISSQNGVQKMSAKILQLLILLTLISTI